VSEEDLLGAIALEGPPESIPEAVLAEGSCADQRIALQIEEAGAYKRYTYGELALGVEELSSALSSLGLQRGSRAAIVFENRPEWVITYLGIVAAGGTAVPLDIQLSSRECGSLLARSGSRFVFVSSGTWPLIKPLVSAAVTVVTVDQPEPGIQHGLHRLMQEQGLRGRSERSVKVVPNDIASLLYTSGTTGEPKGVLLTHWNLVSNARALIMSGLANADDHFVAILPLHHSYPFMVTCLVPLLLRAEITFTQTLKGPELTHCLREARITFFAAVPQVFAMIRRALRAELGRRGRLIRYIVSLLLPLSGWLRRRMNLNPGPVLFAAVHRQLGPSLRILASGGARLDPDVTEDFYRFGFTLLEGYGLTETAPVITFTPLAKPKSGSVGLPIPGVEVRLVNPDANGIGEVAVRGPNVMLGYDGDPEATASSLREGWFHTGDLGYRDPEGYLYLTGRAKEMIVTAGGKNIVPEELEHLYETSPVIDEICLVSAARAGEGEGVHAVVVPNMEYVKAEKILDIRQAVKDELTRIGLSLPPYKRISGLSIVTDPLPRTRLGKIQRYRMAAMVKPVGSKRPQPGPLSEADCALMETETGSIVAKALRPFLEKGRLVTPRDHLDLDLGFDSLRRLELLSALERSVGPLPESLIRDVMTVRELIEQVSALSRGGTVTGEGGPLWRDLLKADPPPDVRDFLSRPPRGHYRLIMSFARALLRVVYRIGFHFRVDGVEHLPSTGPFLLALNHVSFLDPFAVLAAVPPHVLRRMHFIGWQAYFRSRGMRWIARVSRVIPVGVEASVVAALQATALVIRQGGGVVIFPEGQRSIDGQLKSFQHGIGILACELNVPVIPAWIEGTYQAWPVGNMFPRPHSVSLAFGPPVGVTSELMTRWQGEGCDAYKAATKMVRAAMLALAVPSSPAIKGEG
jgi:long-chain acyl-CoA synthetase